MIFIRDNIKLTYHKYSSFKIKKYVKYNKYLICVYII